jgi:hypothetical protein
LSRIKVCVEIIGEACDAGLIPERTDIVAVSGTGRGADPLAIIEAHPSDRFLIFGSGKYRPSVAINLTMSINYH